MNNIFFVKLVVIFSFLFLNCSNIAGQQYLAVPIIAQERTRWCWAASIQMLHKFHINTSTTTQCELATKYEEYYFRNTNSAMPTAADIQNCCVPNSCNFPLPFSKIGLGVDLHYFDLINSYYKFDSMEDIDIANFTWDKIVNEIKSCRPFALFTRITNQAATSLVNHVVVAKGYYESNTNIKYIIVNDPLSFGSERLIPINSLYQPNQLNSALQIAKYIFPKDSSVCKDCPKLIPTTKNDLIAALIENADKKVFIGIDKISYNQQEFNAFLNTKNLYYNNKLVYKQVGKNDSKSYEILVAAQATPSIAVTFEKIGELYHVKEIFHKNIFPFSQNIQLKSLEGESLLKFTNNEFEIIEFLPDFQQFYKVLIKGKPYLSPVVSYPNLQYIPTYLYKEEDVVKELSKQLSLENIQSRDKPGYSNSKRCFLYKLFGKTKLK